MKEEKSYPESSQENNMEIHPIVLSLLKKRGISGRADIEAFLTPDYNRDVYDPFLFRDMRAAVDRINEVIGAGERIVIHGDYDADGLSGAVILDSTLKFLGAQDIEVFLPDREKDGYGLNTNTVNLLDSQNTSLIITTDCGISNVDEVKEAKALGMDVIITDHHEQQEEIPPCLILHPKIAGETYPFKNLAGGGVAFKLAQGLLRNAAEGKSEEEKKKYQSFEKWLLDMVAIASVADMVPLTGENRALVAYGLIVLQKTKRLGLLAILKQAGLIKEGKLTKELDTHSIGFVIGPRMNAAGRMAHANAAYAALIAGNEEDAMRLAADLEKTNMERRQITESMYSEALEQIGEIPEGPCALVAYDPKWSMGVVGLIAGRIMDKLHRPVFILSEINEKIAGSGRSIEGFDCNTALEETKDLYTKFGGHARACGFTLAEKDKLPERKERLNELAKKWLKPENLQKKIEIDAEITISDITWDFVEQLHKMRPFGQGNPEPVFSSKNVEVTEYRGVGVEENHLSMTVTHDGVNLKRCIAFRQPEWVEKVEVGQRLDIIYTIDIDEFNGNKEIKLKIKDIKESK